MTVEMCQREREKEKGQKEREWERRERVSEMDGERVGSKKEMEE